MTHGFIRFPEVNRNNLEIHKHLASTSVKRKKVQFCANYFNRKTVLFAASFYLGIA